MVLSSTLQSALENIYISPLELCNLNCRLCYTNKTKNILKNGQILSFVNRYQAYLDKSENKLSLKSILFCGGEVFTLKSFPSLINRLQAKGIFISLITNGVIDRLSEISDPTNCQLLVSLDGPREVHDQNRGVGNFDKSLEFIKHAVSLGFPVEIMFLVTSQSYSYLDTFSDYLANLTQSRLNLNYITQKTSFYTENHPLSNQENDTPALSPSQILNIKQHYPSIPPKNFGCFQLSLQSNGNFYGCCESPYPLGNIHSRLSSVIKNFVSSLSVCSQCQTAKICGGCCAPDFLCGYKKELGLETCEQIVTTFQSTLL